MQESRRSRSTETAVSLFVLVCLAGVAVGVYCKQFRYDAQVFSNETAGTKTASAGNGPQLGGFAAAGFVPVGKGESFDADTLYIKIDGKADLYLAAGFVKLVCQQYAKESDTNSWIELCAYDMGTGLNALSVYSAQKRPDAVDVNVGTFAYRTPDAVFVCAGKYYIEFGGSAASEELVGAMVATAQRFVNSLGSKAGKIAELELLPKENLVAGSYKLYVKDAYGFDGFGTTFAATYKIEGKEVRAFVCNMGDAAKATAAAAAYKKFVAANGGTETAAANPALTGTVLDVGEGMEIVFARGTYVAGVHEAENKQAAEAVAMKLYRSLGEASNGK